MVAAPPDNQVGQGAPQDTNEPPPGEELSPIRPQPRAKSHGPQPTDCSPNQATLPCVTIQQVIMPPGTGRQVDFGRKFSRVFASDPRAIEVKPISDHVFLIIPLRQETKVETSHGDTYTNYRTLLYGNSDVFVYDDAGNLMGTVEVIVDQSAVRNPPRNRIHSRSYHLYLQLLTFMGWKNA